MIDAKKLEAEIVLLRQEIEKSFLNLQQLDDKRTEYLLEFLKSKQTQHLPDFQAATVSSTTQFQNLEEDFHKIMGYVLLMQEKGPKDQLFKDLLKRAKLMEEILHGFFKERKKQISIASSLAALSSKSMGWMQKRRLVHSLRHERDFITILLGLYKHESERIDAIKEAWVREKRKKGLAITVAGAAWMTPGIGMALAVSILAAYDWANKSSKNYKKLLELVR